jgi:signal transduction histidine kinase
MLAAVVIGRGLGFQFAVVPILSVAAASLVYNAVFAWIYSRYEPRLRAEPQLDRLFTVLQVVADYLAMFLLIHFTGGAWSPLVVFLIFHVIIAAIQFSPGVAHLFAAWAAGGLWLLLFGETAGWLPRFEIVFRGQPMHVLDRPLYAAIMLLLFTATLFITASMVSTIMARLRFGVEELAVTSNELALANDKMNGLYAIVRSIGAERRLDPILAEVTSELADVLEIPAVAVQLLAEDGKTLRYVATHGIPENVLGDKVTELGSSPLNRRILAGESVVLGGAAPGGGDGLQDELSGLGLCSAAMTPLKFEERVIGTLGVYSDEPGRFDRDDARFLRLAAELLAIAIEDARANEALEELMRERTQFMLAVAHNLRAPLSASLGMLDLLRDGDLGEVNEKQVDHAKRIDIRLRALHEMIGELLTIARLRDWSREIPDVVIDLGELAESTESVFRDQAAGNGVRLMVIAEPDLPKVDSGANLLEQMMENLVSNAIKYTPRGGEVEVRLARSGPDDIRIVVRDTGIGIPVGEQDKLFGEFFRASNAKKHSSAGSGLGLTLVKRTVERHRGRMSITSAEGDGTTIEIEIPIHRNSAESAALGSTGELGPN